MDLDVLPCGDVALAQRRVLLDRVGKGVELIGGDATHRELHPNHLDVGLALAVNALAQAELDELVFSGSPRRNFAASVSKSSNSCCRIGMMCPGTFSSTSGLSSEPGLGCPWPDFCSSSSACGAISVPQLLGGNAVESIQAKPGQHKIPNP